MTHMHLIGYMLVPVSHHHGMWRHAASSNEFLTGRWYEDVARTLERAMFDMVFFPDVLAIYDVYGGSNRATLRYGSQGALQLDPLVQLTIMATATRHLGLGATWSTSYFTPFAIARSLASLDHLSGGRAAWNVVTSAQTAEAQNFGLPELPPRAARYDRADEFMEVTFQLWDSWGEGALVLDKERGFFADPDKVHPIDHAGEWLRCRGPLTVPRSPQGRPVIMQAGASDRGLQFAARWGELVFCLERDLPSMQRFYMDLKARVAAAGRAPENCRVLPAIQPIVAETTSMALEKADYVNELVQPEAALATVSTHTGVDMAKFRLDQPVEDVQLETGSRASWDIILRATDAEHLTLGEVAQRFGTSELTPQIVGNPVEIADQMESIFRGHGCDGFIITPTNVPGAFEDFGRLVVPELQRRGLARTSYDGSTLRENLGLPPVTGTSSPCE